MKMTYPLAAIIGRDAVIESLAAQFPQVFPIPLEQGFSLILTTESFYQEVESHFAHLPHFLYALAELATTYGALGYMEAEYLDAYQHHGQIILWGINRYPNFSAEIKDREYPSPFYVTLNQGLALLGVQPINEHDHYHSLGLGSPDDVENPLAIDPEPDEELPDE